MRDCPYPLDALLMHQPPMLLLDRIVAYDDASLTAIVTITKSSLFLAADGVPAHVAIEYMAQACGAYAGAMALDAGAPLKMGFLLGTRNCRLLTPCFRVGDRLLISVTMVFHDEQTAAFDCKVEIDGRLAADARLTVYQPDGEVVRVDEDD
ncbi:MAG: ApeP family dehydratase [Candidatus Binataceae bacterium]